MLFSLPFSAAPVVQRRDAIFCVSTPCTLTPKPLYLSRSALHRLSQRHGMSRLPAAEPAEKKLKEYPIGYRHVDFAEVHTEEGRVYLFVAIDRTSKLAFAELQPQAAKMLAADFLILGDEVLAEQEQEPHTAGIGTAAAQLLPEAIDAGRAQARANEPSPARKAVGQQPE